MFNGSDHKLSYCMEASSQTLPTNPRFQRLPDVRTSLALQRDTLPTERVKADRFPSEPRSGAKTGQGDIPFEFSFKDYDDFLASALQGSWVASNGTNDTVAMSIDGVTTDPLDTIEVGDTYATASGVVTFESVNAYTGKVVMTYVEAGTKTAFEITETGAGGSVTIDGEVFFAVSFSDVAEDYTLKAGNTRPTMSILREFGFASATDSHQLFKGCEVAQMQLTITANAIVSGSFTIFGLDMELGDTAPTGATYIEASSNRPFDSFTGSIKEGGVAIATVTEMSFTVNNGHAPKYTVASAASGTPSTTDSVIEGTLTTNFETAALYKKFIEEEWSSLEVELVDNTGAKYTLTFGRVKFGSGGQPDVSGPGPVTLAMPFTAHKLDADGTHFKIRRQRPLAV